MTQNTIPLPPIFGEKAQFIDEIYQQELRTLEEDDILPNTPEAQSFYTRMMRSDMIAIYLHVTEAEKHLADIKGLARTIRNLLWAFLLIPLSLIYILYKVAH